MKRLYIALFIWFVISLVVALFFYDKTVISFIKYFVLAASIQCIFQYFFNQFLNAKYSIELTKLEASLAQEENRFVKSLACPCYLKNSQDVKIDINKDNKYKCNKCEKDISVLIDVNTAMATKPLDEVKSVILNTFKSNE